MGTFVPSFPPSPRVYVTSRRHVGGRLSRVLWPETEDPKGSDEGTSSDESGSTGSGPGTTPQGLGGEGGPYRLGGTSAQKHDTPLVGWYPPWDHRVLYLGTGARTGAGRTSVDEITDGPVLTGSNSVVRGRKTLFLVEETHTLYPPAPRPSSPRDRPGVPDTDPWRATAPVSLDSGGAQSRTSPTGSSHVKTKGGLFSVVWIVPGEVPHGVPRSPTITNRQSQVFLSVVVVVPHRWRVETVWT